MIMADFCASFKKDIELENREISPKSDISNGVFKISTERDCHEVKSVLNAILKDLYILENMKIYEELLKCSAKHYFHALLCTSAQACVRERHNRLPFDYLDLEITAVQNISNAKKNKEIGYPYHQNSVNDSVDSQRDDPKSKSCQAQNNQFDAAKSPYISSNIILFSISLNVMAILFVFHSFDISRNVYAMSRFFIVLCFVALCIFASCNIDQIFTEAPDEGIKFDQVLQLSEEDHAHSRSKSKSPIVEADHSDQSVSTDLNNYSALHGSRLHDEKLAANLLQILEDDDFSYTVGDCDDSIDDSCSDLMEAFSYTSPMDLEIPGYAVCDQCGHELRWYPLLDSDLPEAEQGRHKEIKVCLKSEDIKDIAIGDSLEKTTNYDIEEYNGCLSSWHSSPDIACSLMQQRSDLIEKSVNSGHAPCATTGLSLSTYKKFNVILESTSTSFESLSSIIQETHSSKIISSSEISSNTSCGTQSPISQTASRPKHVNRNPSVEKTHTSLKNIIRIKKNYGNFYSFSSGETSSLLTQLSDELDSCLDAGDTEDTEDNKDTEDTEDNKDTEDTEVASSSAFGKKSVLRRRLSAIARSWKENLTVSAKRIKYEKCTE